MFVATPSLAIDQHFEAREGGDARCNVERVVELWLSFD
jgi:hypothetical protein